MRSLLCALGVGSALAASAADPSEARRLSDWYHRPPTPPHHSLGEAWPPTPPHHHRGEPWPPAPPRTPPRHHVWGEPWPPAPPVTPPRHHIGEPWPPAPPHVPPRHFTKAEVSAIFQAGATSHAQQAAEKEAAAEAAAEEYREQVQAEYNLTDAQLHFFMAGVDYYHDYIAPFKEVHNLTAYNLSAVSYYLHQAITPEHLEEYKAAVQHYAEDELELFEDGIAHAEEQAEAEAERAEEALDQALDQAHHQVDDAHHAVEEAVDEAHHQVDEALHEAEVALNAELDHELQLLQETNPELFDAIYNQGLDHAREVHAKEAAKQAEAELEEALHTAADQAHDQLESAHHELEDHHATGEEELREEHKQAGSWQHYMHSLLDDGN